MNTPPRQADSEMENMNCFQLALASEVFQSFIRMFYGDEELEFGICLAKPKMRGSRIQESVPVIHLLERDEKGEVREAFPMFELIVLPGHIANEVYEPLETSRTCTMVVNPHQGQVEGDLKRSPNWFNLPVSAKCH